MRINSSSVQVKMVGAYEHETKRARIRICSASRGPEKLWVFQPKRLVSEAKILQTRSPEKGLSASLSIDIAVDFVTKRLAKFEQNLECSCSGW